MKKSLALFALLLTIVPSLLYGSGACSLAAVRGFALVGTLVWFVLAPLWMWREQEN